MPKENPLSRETQIASAHLRAREIAKEIFHLTEVPRDVLNEVYDSLVTIDGKGHFVLDADAREDIEAARAWAKEVYGESSPEATFDAYRIAFEDIDADPEDQKRQHRLAREVAQVVFELTHVPREVLNGTYNCLPYFEEGDEDTTKSVELLLKARAWAREVYGDDSPEATFDAHERVFAPRDEEDEGEEEEDN